MLLEPVLCRPAVALGVREQCERLVLAEAKCLHFLLGRGQLGLGERRALLEQLS